jgi:16S rRNA (cytosine967-C5)-methyltransferase
MSAASARQAQTETSDGLAVRRAAVEILLRVDRDRAFADLLLGQRIEAFHTADRRLLTRLVLGTLAWRGRLDYELARRSGRKLPTIDPVVLEILRLGLFQLRLLTRIPPHAAVNTAVALTHRLGIERAAGFVNAILRNAVRSPISLPPRAADEAGYLAIAYSHPRWLVEKFLEWRGPAAESLMTANNEPAPNAVRLNLTRAPADKIVALLEQEGLTLSRCGRFPETVVLEGLPLSGSTGLRDGLLYPQSEASQFVARMLAPDTAALIVDCAAAPGGKSTHLAELAGPAARVVSIDFNLSGLARARALAGNLHHAKIFFVRADTRLALPIRPGSADFVLLDAPCTGLGTLRQHPEIRWRLNPEDIERMAALQSRMLDNAAAIVRIGGILVYAVCSIAPAEGYEVVRAFLSGNPAFEIAAVPASVSQLNALIDKDGFLRTSPDGDGLDGFFAARLRRIS